MGHLFLTLALVFVQDFESEDFEVETFPAVTGAALHDRQLICLEEGGTFAVWNVDDGRPDPALADRLRLKGTTYFALDGPRLFAVVGLRLYEVPVAGGAWKRVAEFVPPSDNWKDQLQALVVVDGAPWLVFATKVVDPLNGREFVPPVVKDKRTIWLFRVSAVQADGHRLWIGTSMGEWGGWLVGLDVRSGQWSEHFGPHNVTGIAPTVNGEVVVSWSSHHFSADGMLQTHRRDATSKGDGRDLPDRYYQRATYSPFDRTLYAVEGNELVRARAGRPARVARLEGALYGREPLAIGVAPGVLAIFPIGPKALIVVPALGAPWKVQDGKVTLLKRPIGRPGPLVVHRPVPSGFR